MKRLAVFLRLCQLGGEAAIWLLSSWYKFGSRPTAGDFRKSAAIWRGRIRRCFSVGEASTVRYFGVIIGSIGWQSGEIIILEARIVGWPVQGSHICIYNIYIYISSNYIYKISYQLISYEQYHIIFNSPFPQDSSISVPRPPRTAPQNGWIRSSAAVHLWLLGFYYLSSCSADSETPASKYTASNTGWMAIDLKSAALSGALELFKSDLARRSSWQLHTNIYEPLSPHSQPLKNIHKSLSMHFVHKCPPYMICVNMWWKCLLFKSVLDLSSVKGARPGCRATPWFTFLSKRVPGQIGIFGSDELQLPWSMFRKYQEIWSPTPAVSGKPSSNQSNQKLSILDHSGTAWCVAKTRFISNSPSLFPFDTSCFLWKPGCQTLNAAFTS